MSVLIWRNNTIEVLTSEELEGLVDAKMKNYPANKHDEQIKKKVIENVVAHFDSYEDHYPLVVEVENEIRGFIEKLKGSPIPHEIKA
ncbi:MAG TPA: hypothetical protein HA367_08390 [Candidatus Methanofastidiosum sp.]|nr:hypothetical protein [Methanofastidiosum sp.]